MRIFIITSLIFINFSVLAQTKESIELCLALQENSFSNNIEAEKALDKILNTIGAKRNFIISPCNEIENAVAISYRGLRYILYDKAFLNKLNSYSNNWFGMTVLAHEVGHHINGHSIDVLLALGKVVEPKSLKKRRKQELEADEFAAFVLAKLGAPLEEIKKNISLISTDGDDSYSTHPSRQKRLSAIVSGYNKALGNGNSNNIDYKTSLNNKTNDSEIFNINYELLSIDLDKANSYVNSATNNNELGNYSKAAKQLELAYIYSGELDYLYYSASAFVNAVLYREALKPYLFLYNNNYDVESRRAEIVKNITLIYVDLGFNDLAMDFMKLARKLSPKDIGLILTEADLYIKLGDEARFASLMKEAIAQDPNNAILYYNLGVVNDNKGNQRASIAYYKKAIILDPTYEASYLNLASVILKGEAGIVNEMNALGNSAAEDRKYDALKQKRKSLFLEAVPYLEQLVKINPNNADALITLENIYSAIEDVQNYRRIRRMR